MAAVMGGGKNYDDKSEMAYYWLETNMGRVLLVVLFAWLGLWGFLLEGQTGLDPVRSFIHYLGAELAGIGIGAVAIDALNERRQTMQLKAQLIRQMGSQHNDVADTAIRELAHHEWLYDGSLKGAMLEGANLGDSSLEGACLDQVNLTRAKLIRAQMVRARLNSAILVHANLEMARLGYAEMKGACLFKAILRGAILTDADLSNADLKQANLIKSKLQNANLTGADIKDAELGRANLRGTNLREVRNWTIEQLQQGYNFSNTVMPDGKRLGFIPPDTPERQTPDFDEWKAQYLATHDCTETDLRDPSP